MPYYQTPFLPTGSQAQRQAVTAPEPRSLHPNSVLEKPDFLPHSNATNKTNALPLAGFRKQKT